MKRLLSTSCLLFSCALAACSSDDSNNNGGGVGGSAGSGRSNGTGGSAGSGGGAGAGGTAGFGGMGGVAGIGGGVTGGVVVDVPEGAGTVQITIAELDPSDFPDPEELVSPVFDIGPSGTMFDIPITIGLPIDEDTPPGTAIELVRYDEVLDEWESLGGSILGGLIVAKTDHLTPFSAAKTPSGPGCDNVWSGGPGTIPPLHTVGGLTVAPGVKLSEDVVFSGPSEISLGSSWSVPACKATVSGSFGPVAGDGAWTDYSNGGGGPISASGGGAFSIQFETEPPDNERGPYLGLTDPCQAAVGVYSYNLNIGFAADCEDPCDGVDCSDGNPCTLDTCMPLTGECEHTPTGGTCGSGGNGLCIQDMCIVEVPMAQDISGNTVCADEGLACAGVPVIQPTYQEACKAFHPSASVTATVNGWRQSVYCNNSTGLACGGKTDNCHHCLACSSTGLDCTTSNSPQLASLFAQCVEP